MHSDTIFLINTEGQLERVPHTQYESEGLLQRLIESHPELLVGDQINPDMPPRWMLIGREVGIPDREGGSDRWAIDHILLDQRGKPTFVEVKRSSDTRIRREVVGQMLDYAANARIYWPKDRIRALATEASGGIEELEIKLSEFLCADATDVSSSYIEDYWETVDRNLRNGEVRLLFVADSIPTELRRIIEFLNEHMPLIEVLGIEIRHYEGQNVRALVPRVVGQTEFARQQKGTRSRPSQKITREEFLSMCAAGSRSFFIELFTCAEREGYSLLWNVSGFSVRLPVDSRNLMSLFYGYPASEDRSSPEFHAYLADVTDSGVSNTIRQKLLSLADFQEKGKHTLKIKVDEHEAEKLRPKVEEMLRQAKYHVMGVKQ